MPKKQKIIKKIARKAPDYMIPDWGDVVVAEFPFSDLGQSKRRPVVFLGYGHHHEAPRSERDKIIIAITSRVDSTIPGAFIDDWKSAGLLKPCAFKPMIMTVESKFIKQKVGKLSARSKDKLKRLLRYWMLDE